MTDNNTAGLNTQMQMHRSAAVKQYHDSLSNPQYHGAALLDTLIILFTLDVSPRVHRVMYESWADGPRQQVRLSIMPGRCT